MEAVEPDYLVTTYTWLTDFQETQVNLPSGSLLFDGQERQVTLILPQKTEFSTGFEVETRDGEEVEIHDVAYADEGIQLDAKGTTLLFLSTVHQETCGGETLVKTVQTPVDLTMKQLKPNQTKEELFDSLKGKDIVVIDQTANSITTITQTVWSDFVVSTLSKTCVQDDVALELSYTHYTDLDEEEVKWTSLFQDLPFLQIKG